ncbi:hypothetical protein AB0F74_16540 [Nocardia salmonicida]
MTHRRPARRRAVEKDAAANVAVGAFYTAAAAWWRGMDEGLIEQIETWCTNLERIALAPDGGAGPIAFVENIARILWPDPEGRPTTEELARTMAKIGQRGKEAQGLVECEVHGWLEPFLWGECTECPCQVPNYDARQDQGGRPRLYCSDACRQRAYRRRKREIRGSRH